MNWLNRIYDPRYKEIAPFRKNPKFSFEWIRRAAKTGDPESQTQLGTHYINGNGVKKDFKTGAQWYRRAAQNGDGWAHFLLGLCYRDGWGVPFSPRLARIWFKKAIALKISAVEKALAKMEASGVPGEVERLRELANHYRTGDGVPKDLRKFLKCLNRAAALEKRPQPFERHVSTWFITVNTRDGTTITTQGTKPKTLNSSAASQTTSPTSPTPPLHSDPPD